MLHHVNFDQDEFDEPRPPESYGATQAEDSWLLCYREGGTIAAKYPIRVIKSVQVGMDD